MFDYRWDDHLQLNADVSNAGACVVEIGENSPDPEFSNESTARAKDASYQFISIIFNTTYPPCAALRVAHLMETRPLSVEVARRYSFDETTEKEHAVMDDSFLGKFVTKPLPDPPRGTVSGLFHRVARSTCSLASEGNNLVTVVASMRSVVYLYHTMSRCGPKSHFGGDRRQSPYVSPYVFRR